MTQRADTDGLPPKIPTTATVPDSLLQALVARLYGKTMDNCDRGSYVEQLVASALGDDWQWVGAGWHPWDFQSKPGIPRIRIQVRQSAMHQLWHRPKDLKPSFPTEIKSKPTYTERDHPGISIEEKGRFCEIFIFAWHGIADATCDQRLPEQWEFFVVPENALGTLKRIMLSELQSTWLAANGGRKTTWETLKDALETLARDLRTRTPSPVVPPPAGHGP